MRECDLSDRCLPRDREDAARSVVITNNYWRLGSHSQFWLTDFRSASKSCSQPHKLTWLPEFALFCLLFTCVAYRFFVHLAQHLFKVIPGRPTHYRYLTSTQHSLGTALPCLMPGAVLATKFWGHCPHQPLHHRVHCLQNRKNELHIGLHLKSVISRVANYGVI